jgi:hypothetical protein
MIGGKIIKLVECDRTLFALQDDGAVFKYEPNAPNKDFSPWHLIMPGFPASRDKFPRPWGIRADPEGGIAMVASNGEIIVRYGSDHEPIRKCFVRLCERMNEP